MAPGFPCSATGGTTPDAANSDCSQVALLPIVTTDSPPPAWDTQKTTQAPLAEVPAGIQYPAVPKKERRGRKGVEDDGGVIVPPDHLVAGVGSSW